MMGNVGTQRARQGGKQKIGNLHLDLVSFFYFRNLYLFCSQQQQLHRAKQAVRKRRVWSLQGVWLGGKSSPNYWAQEATEAIAALSYVCTFGVSVVRNVKFYRAENDHPKHKGGTRIRNGARGRLHTVPPTHGMGSACVPPRCLQVRPKSNCFVLRNWSNTPLRRRCRILVQELKKTRAPRPHPIIA